MRANNNRNSGIRRPPVLVSLRQLERCRHRSLPPGRVRPRVHDRFPSVAQVGLHDALTAHRHHSSKPTSTRTAHADRVRDGGMTTVPCASQSSPAPASTVADVHGDTEKLRRFLQAYWLRPENALWMTLRSDALDRAKLDPPMIDVACGDGIYTFLHLGGVLDPDFDVFTAVGSLERVHHGHADMFDVGAINYAPRIVSAPSTQPDMGVDLKPNLLSKATKLGLYRRLIRHDANAPFPLPTDSFRTVYCNAAYWVENIHGFLRELARITQPKGRIILQVKLDAIRSCTLDPLRAVLGDRFLDIIGRGRFDTWPTLASRSEWDRRFQKAGLDVLDALPFVSSTHAHLWDVGLRPLAPLLVRMANGLSSDNRSAIKQDWVELFAALLAPLRRFDLSVPGTSTSPVELQFKLTPR